MNLKPVCAEPSGVRNILTVLLFADFGFYLPPNKLLCKKKKKNFMGQEDKF